jgi:2-polyprenyl-3-methyl-5-hydroxy-6-metoxy-1,4-benzoquinol methylase
MEHHDLSLIAESRAIWDANAEAWDQRIGGGGGWQTILVFPTIEQLLVIQPTERVLDIACGNGQFSHRLAELGASVVASDFSPRLIECAKCRIVHHTDRIAYHVADATDEEQLLALAGPEERPFDAAVCSNALMDMPAIEPVFRAVAQLLKPAGRFVFSIMHPCFNGLSISMQPELADYAATPTYAIKVSRYLSTEVTKGMAIADQPQQQCYWHRSLHVIFNSAVNCGLLLDRMEEPRFTRDEPSANAFDWSNYDMPPLLFARLRPAR